jgi:hypothetical protein
MSAFTLEDGVVYRTYSAYARGLDFDHHRHLRPDGISYVATLGFVCRRQDRY